MGFAFKFPDIGEGIHEGKILKVYVKEGDRIKEGDAIFNVETDKVVTDLPSPRSGTIRKLHCRPEQVVMVDQVLVEIDMEEAGKTEEPEEKGAGVVGQIEVAAKGSAVMSAFSEHLVTKKAEPVSKDTKVLATPAARKMAKEFGVSILQIEGTGPGGRVLKSDIENAQSQKIVAAASENTSPVGQKEPFSMIRKTILRHMTDALAIPHFAIHEEVEVSDLVVLREKYSLATDQKLSYVALFIKAAAMALRRFPKFNASMDIQNSVASYHSEVHIGFAADTSRGLMVPVIRHADKLSIKEIHESLVTLSDAARKATIALSDIKGGTFTVTSIGSIAGTMVHPVINPPEVAILGLGRIQKKPVILDDGTVGVGQILDVSVCADHRWIDGADAARFIGYMCQLLHRPTVMLIES